MPVPRSLDICLQGFLADEGVLVVAALIVPLVPGRLPADYGAVLVRAVAVVGLARSPVPGQ